MKLNLNGDFSICKGPFKGNLDSLQGYQCPEWFKDAKFGIWSHWGPQSVAMYGDWFYNLRYPYQTWNETLEMLIDIVSKNGNRVIYGIRRKKTKYMLFLCAGQEILQFCVVYHMAKNMSLLSACLGTERLSLNRLAQVCWYIFRTVVPAD